MFIDVGDGHRVYYELHGNPVAPPLVVLHGGPGGGLHRSVLHLLDLRRWHVLLFDQRGCGRSTSSDKSVDSVLRHNTTWHLVADMERLRVQMGVDAWALFGGSWGTTIAMAYASRHPGRVTGMVLRGVCLMEPWEADWLYSDKGAARLFPDAWVKFKAGANTQRQSSSPDNLMRVYTRLLHSKNRQTRRAAAKSWWGWESAVSTLRPAVDTTPIKNVESLALLEHHYFSHMAWIRPGQLLAAAAKWRFPVQIVQGRYDLVCPPASAFALARALDPRQVTLTWTLAGHAATETETASALRIATNRLASMVHPK